MELGQTTSPDRKLELARLLRKLQTPSKHTREIIIEAADALSRSAHEQSFISLFGDLMERTLKDILSGLINDIKTTRADKIDLQTQLDAQNVQLAAATQKLTDAATQATADAKTIGDLQAQVKALGTPVDPNNVIAADDPARQEANAILDADAPATPVTTTPAPTPPVVTAPPVDTTPAAPAQVTPPAQ